MRKLAIACLCVGVLHAARAVELRLSAFFITEGGSLRVTCRVQRDPENRDVEWGIVNYTSRARTIEGADAAITYEQLFVKVPCGSDTAFCRVKNTAGDVRAAVQRFTVTGCD